MESSSSVITQWPWLKYMDHKTTKDMNLGKGHAGNVRDVDRDGRDIKESVGE